MNEEKVRNVHTNIWLSPEMDQQIRKIAAGEGSTVSTVLRNLITLGLVSGGYVSGSNALPEVVRGAVSETLQPQVERLASISAKAAHIAAASFFLNVYVMRQVVPEGQLSEYDTVAAQARKLGVEYLKLRRDQNLDDFLAQAIHRLGDGEEF